MGSKSKKRSKPGSSDSGSKKAKQGNGRHYTVSIALPGSIVDNAQTLELKTYLAGQIARALAIFCIDEVIIFDDQSKTKPDRAQGGSSSKGTAGNEFLSLILSYLETPQYLRKDLFPRQRDLQFVGLLNPLDAPHHMRRTEASRWREGIVVDKRLNKQNADQEAIEEEGSNLVNVGLNREIKLDRKLKPNVRVTVEIDLSEQHRQGGSARTIGVAVPPQTPREKEGIYWGYNVRQASSLTAALLECPFEGGYDLTIGTSENGDAVQPGDTLPEFKHLLIVFGGVLGLERAVDDIEELNMTSSDTRFLFDKYVNVCPNQGSRTIRTEEAMLIALALLNPMVTQAGAKK